MAIANWKLPHVEPEEYGLYLVTESIDSDDVATAYWGPRDTRPFDRAAGWFQQLNGRVVEIDIIAWDEMPLPYKRATK